MHMKISSAKWQPFFPGGDELNLSHHNMVFSVQYEFHISSVNMEVESGDNV